MLLIAVRTAAKPCQIATRNEPGCLSYDFFTSLDDPQALVYVECFKSEQAHAEHSDMPYVKKFLEAVRPLIVSTKFETINPAE